MRSLTTCARLLGPQGLTTVRWISCSFTNFKDWKQRLLHLRLAVAKRLSLTYAHQDQMDNNTCVVIFCVGQSLDAEKIEGLGGIAVSKDGQDAAGAYGTYRIDGLSTTYLSTDASSSTRDADRTDSVRRTERHDVPSGGSHAAHAIKTSSHARGSAMHDMHARCRQFTAECTQHARSKWYSHAWERA
jgi:hypothetical protein